MKSLLLRRVFCCALSLLPLAFSNPACAYNPGDIIITEIMYNSAGEEPKWEWVEIKNTTGADIDLAGWVIDDDDDNNLTDVNIGAAGGTTTVPAGGVAVLYNASSTNGLSADPSRFTNSWGSVSTLIGVSPVTAIASPDAIGLWQNTDDYLADDLMVTSGTRRTFNSTITKVDFSAGMGYPSATNGKSLAWKGTGNVNDAAQWVASTDGDAYGAHANLPTTINGAMLNSALDRGTPGTPPPTGTGALGGLLVTEIMYNPDSNIPAESAWEWVEVFNNTGSLIDFADPLNSFYQAVFDDDDDSHKTAANLTTGSIPQGETAVLFNAATNTLQNMQDAWGSSINFIPVASWTDLGNGGDLVAIWPSLTAYNADALPGTTSPRRSTNNASSFVLYDDETMTAMWPADDGQGSITLTGIDVDQHTDTSWVLSDSYNATQLYATVVDHPGGDFGSPGFVPTSSGGLLGDFNHDNMVDAADYTIWRDNFPATFDASDYDDWKNNFGATAGAGAASLAVPEPATIALVMLGFAGPMQRRRNK